MPVQFESSSSAFLPQSTAPSIVVPAPAGIVKGDLLLAVGLVNQAGAIFVAASNGLVILTQDKPGAGNPVAFVATKIAGESEPGSFIFSHGLAGNGAWNVGILRISGACGVEQPIAPGFTQNIFQANPLIAPSIITVKDNDLIIRAFMFDTTGSEPATVSTPAGTTLREAIIGPQPPFSSDPQCHIFTEDALKTPPGATGTASITLAAFNGNVRGVQYTLAVEELPSGAGWAGAMPRDKEGQVIIKGQKILNPFHLPKRHCMCPIGNCTCL